MDSYNIGFAKGINRRHGVYGDSGELSECINVIPDSGEIVNIKPPKDIGINIDNGRLIYIHITSDGIKHYLYMYDNGSSAEYSLCDTHLVDNAYKKTVVDNLGQEPVDISNIGNVLIVSLSSGIKYYVWKSSGYSVLGSIPSFSMSFSLKYKGVVGDTVPASSVKPDTFYIGSGEYIKATNTENALNYLVSQSSKLYREIQHDKKEFAAPFFVRYGLRMIDGSVIHQSAPILMEANKGVYPLWYYFSSGDNNVLYSELKGFSLQYKFIGGVADFSSWRDVITGITIAVTPPIYEIDQGAEFSEGISKYDAKRFADIKASLYSVYGENLSKIQESTRSVGAILTDDTICIIPPHFSGEQYKNNVLAASNFYIVKEIKWDDVKTNYTEIDIPVATSNVASLPRMEDDFNSQNLFAPKVSFMYNNRLNIANITEFIRFGGKQVISPIAAYGGSSPYPSTIAYVYIKDNGQEYVLRQNLGAWTSYPEWAYYPHEGAYRLLVYVNINGSSVFKWDVALEKHPFLNGSYWYSPNGDSSLHIEQIAFNAIDIPYSENPTVVHENYIFTSKVNNPFFFPTSGQDTIGTGSIVSVSTTAKALSQGQFGQFPLYAFCSDGIWALSVNDNGSFYSTNPVSRDVCINKNSICQIDSAVIFATEQGIKILEGAETALLSDVLYGENVDEDVFFSDLDASHQHLNTRDVSPFSDVVRNVVTAYDYPNRLLHFYGDTAKHYVFSLESKQWAYSDYSLIRRVVHGYPYSTLQADNGNLLEYNNVSDYSTVRHGLILTKPLSFNAPLARKLLSELKIITKKMRAEKAFSVAVFASDDCYHWYKVSSLKARSWKFFRLRIQTSMTDHEALSSAVIRYQLRFTNKLR